MLQGNPGSAGARTPNKSRSNSSTPSVQPSRQQKQQQVQQRKQKAAASTVQQGSNGEQKRPAQRVSTLQSPPEAKRQARAPIREAISPVRPDPPSDNVILSNIVRLAAEDKGSLEFQGQIKFARTSKEAWAWVTELLHDADCSAHPIILGFDSETPVKWQKQDGKWSTRQERVALLQLSYHKPSSTWPVCLLLQLSALGFRRMRIVELLAHPNIVKVGMGVAADIHELQRDYSDAAACEPQGLLDLDLLAHACGVYKAPPSKVLADEQQKLAKGIKTFNRRDSWSLAGLLEQTTGYSLVKNRKVTQSDWSRQPLSEQQVSYAAADAYASLVCCMALQVNWLQQQSARLLQHQLIAEPFDFDPEQPQQQQQGLVAGPLQMGLWELSKGGSNKFRKTTSDAQELWQGFLQQCCSRTGRRLKATQENARMKAEVLDPLDWQLGYYFDPDPAHSGWQDTPF